MFEKLRAMLVADPDVLAIVGKRIFAGVVPESEKLPAISAWTERTERHEPIDNANGIRQQLWQVNCNTHSSMDASKLADAVEKALHRRSAPGIQWAETSNRFDDPPGLFATRRTIIEVNLTEERQ